MPVKEIQIFGSTKPDQKLTNGYPGRVTGRGRVRFSNVPIKAKQTEAGANLGYP